MPEFPWGIGDFFDTVGDQLKNFLDNLSGEQQESGLSALLAPVSPYNNSRVLTPLVTVAGVVSLLLLSGVALGALATLFTALLAVYFLLSEVFGYNIQLAQPYSPA